jgi:endonuclease YncB( thermonuclease family)
MTTLNRSTLRARKRVSFKGLLVTLILACTFLVSFLGAVVWLDTHGNNTEQPGRPLRVMLEGLFSPDANDGVTEIATRADPSDELPDGASELPDEHHVLRRPSGAFFTIEVSAPLDIVDARTFVADGLILRVNRIRTPARDAICFDEEDRLWACGLQARAAFNNLTRDTGVICEGTRFEELELALVDCKAGEGDLATALVGAGFAAPRDSSDHIAPGLSVSGEGNASHGASHRRVGSQGDDGAHQDSTTQEAVAAQEPLAAQEDMDAALHVAQEEKRGMWNGGWRVRD